MCLYICMPVCDACVCIHVCMKRCLCVYMYTPCIHAFAHAQVCMNARVCMNACAYVFECV